LGGFLSRRDRIYPLSLLVPFAAYNLALKAYDVTSRPEKLGFARIIKLMRSDAFFNLGYALWWIGLFGAARRGPLRHAVIFLLVAREAEEEVVVGLGVDPAELVVRG
jgi:lipoteichoic acid synthase